MVRNLKVVALMMGALAFLGTASTASAVSKCAGSKIKSVAKKTCCKLQLEAKEASKGVPKDPIKDIVCGQKMTDAFAKADGKFPDCITTNDANDLETKVDAFVDDIDDDLSTVDDPPVVLSKCAGCKLKAVCKKAKCKLNLRAKVAAKGTALDPVKDAACEQKMLAAFAKCEAANDCLAPTGDAGAIEAKVDAFVDDVVAELPDSPTSTTTTSATTTSAASTTSTTLFPPCGSATAPECDGICSTAGDVCIQTSPGVCGCQAFPTACQVIGTVPPSCWGDCGTTGACVHDGGSGCMCAP